MILKMAAKGKKPVAVLMLVVFYLEMVLPPQVMGGVSSASVYTPVHHSPDAVVSRHVLPKTMAPAPIKEAKAEGGPTQPESQEFHSVNGGNMVDLFTGDFSYSIPLLDVGGYPVAIGYNSGITMDQEASWVGLGWNINPGSVTRNMRGLPDDFDGVDSVQKTMSIKENKTVGVTVGADLELFGFPKQLDSVNVTVGGSFGVFKNSYKGWGVESGLNANIRVGAKGMGSLSGGLSVNNNSQDGVSFGTGLSAQVTGSQEAGAAGYTGALQVGSGISSRGGIKGLQLSASLSQYKIDDKNQKKSMGTSFDRNFSFAKPSFLPSMTMPYTSSSFILTAKVGFEVKGIHPSVFASGYVSNQYIDEADKRMSLPAYGYLNYQHGVDDAKGLLDYNREKEIAYREKPAMPNIAIPSYTYDVFSISGEGTGGMFRAYRGDIGYVNDHLMRSKDKSLSGSADIGTGDIVHAGVDMHFTRATTQTGAWKEQNPMAGIIRFRESDKTFEAAYFRNPSEKSVNTKQFYNAIGGDDVVAVDLYQPNTSSAFISTTTSLNRYRNSVAVEKLSLTKANSYRTERDKRTQAISYLTAEEASVTGLTKYIENFNENQYDSANCNFTPITDDLTQTGLKGEYFIGKNFDRANFTRTDATINFKNINDFNLNRPAGSTQMGSNFSARWTGRLKVDVTGEYVISITSDDGVKLFVNDVPVIDKWIVKSGQVPDIARLNLVAGQVLNIRIEYFQAAEKAKLIMNWAYAGTPNMVIPAGNLYQMPTVDVFPAGPTMTREKRVNNFRKPNHISEIDVLNADGRRYIYGLPVYNLKQKEATFAVSETGANTAEGLVQYGATDNTTGNNKGNDHYFTAEETPAYAHSFLLTGILSDDYIDVTGDGISDDDPGNAVKFNYSKIAGISNPYAWRLPYSQGATYNEGLKTDNRDGRGSYIYGEKELWYLNSIESKNMVATFKIAADRNDQPSIDENGNKSAGKVVRRLEEINLYVKADFKKNGAKARPVKTVHFAYSDKLCKGINGAAGKLTLDSIWFSYNGNEKGRLNPYVFNYHSNNPGYSNKSSDRWGNYKPAIQNPGSASGNLLHNGDYPYALQDSTLAAQNAAAWTLDSIQLPSGARMKVIYESDDYAFVQNKRAAQMFAIAGYAANKPVSVNDYSDKLYSASGDNFYVAVNVPRKVSSDKEVYAWYLEGIKQLYFKVRVKVPGDKWGSGHEYVNTYATIVPGGYGFFNNGNTIWLKLTPVSEKGETDKPGSNNSPLALSALQFLRLNLPSKAYPGSDVGDELELGDAVKVLLTSATNMIEAVTKFNTLSRLRGWCRETDVQRSYVRLNNPFLKKYGGGLRVKSIRTYDHWNAMTQQNESVYGKEYIYTTTRLVNGVQQTVSSGVASWEPMLGGEENPFREPLEYMERIAPLAPVNLGYTELPLGEGLYPAPAVGYSRVRTRSVNLKNARSANGFDEATFYTSYDFPVITDRTSLADNKKRYKPGLANLLKINAKHYVAVTQGFKVELNDMNGKPRSQAAYAEGGKDPITSAEYFYKVDNESAEFKHLNNVAKAIDKDGNIDETALIGEDIELMMDMREQRSLTNATNINLNSDIITFPWPPVFLIPSLLNLAQREETKFRSAAVTKVVYRHGLLDRVVAIDKGSQVTTRNLLYDAETGEPVLTATQNEFNDDVYNFSYAAAWMYDGMSGAYKNLGAVFNNVYMQGGRVTQGIAANDISRFFINGDELLVYSHEKVAGDDCTPAIATFPSAIRLYAVDLNATTGGTPDIYFVKQDGQPFTGNDILMKIVRSGRKNLSASAGEVTMLANPLVKVGNVWTIKIDDDSKVVAASMIEYKPVWQVADIKKSGAVTGCLSVPYAQYVSGKECGPVIYGNEEVRGTFAKNDCPAGVSGGAATYVVPAGSYSSTISQDDADAQAWADVEENGQLYANANGVCNSYFYSDALSASYTRNNCPSGNGTSVPFSLAAGADSSLISKADANAKAQQRMDLLGQANANANGSCGYRSAAIAYKQKNCSYGTGSTVFVDVPEGYAVSNISQAEADAAAQSHAQDLADANGVCELSGQLFITCNSAGYADVTFFTNNVPPPNLTLLVGFVEEFNGQTRYIGNNSPQGSLPIFTPEPGWVPVMSVNNYLPFVFTTPASVPPSQYTIGGTGPWYQYGYSTSDRVWPCHNGTTRALRKIYVKIGDTNYPGLKPNFVISAGTLDGAEVINVP